MLKGERQNTHHSKLPRPGEIGHLLGLCTVDPRRRCMVSHYPLTDSPECIQNAEGEYTTPSTVLFLENETLVGRQAVDNAWENQTGEELPDFAAAFDQLFLTEDIEPIFTKEIRDIWGYQPKIVVWVKSAMGGAAFLPLLTHPCLPRSPWIHGPRPLALAAYLLPRRFAARGQDLCSRTLEIANCRDL